MINVSVKENYIEVKHGIKNEKTLRIYLSKDLQFSNEEIKRKFEMEIPIRDCKIITNEDGVLTLIPHKRYTIFMYSVGSDFKGTSNIMVEEYCEEVVKIWRYVFENGDNHNVCIGFFNSTKQYINIRIVRTGERINKINQVESIIRIGKEDFDKEEIVSGLDIYQ